MIRLVIYRVAVPEWRMVDNRYSTGRIGMGVVLGKWCVSFVWKQPGRTEHALTDGQEL